uniref:hypothetical protein n=1 Tax=Prevotella sp. TaxID=59823 RepID=UPI00402507AF
GRLPFSRSNCTCLQVLNFGNNILHFHAYYPKASARLKIKERKMTNGTASSHDVSTDKILIRQKNISEGVLLFPFHRVI